MSSDDIDNDARPLIDFGSVLDASLEQAREDRRKLKEKPPRERLRARQDQRDLTTLLLGAHENEDGPLRFLLGDFPDRFQPSEQERLAALMRLARRWARREWRVHDPLVREASYFAAVCDGVPVSTVKRRALESSILEALYDARERQITRISRDRAMSFGSNIHLLQKKDLEALRRGDYTDEQLDKLRRGPVGLRIFPPYRLLSPIEAAFAGFDPTQVRPVDLVPSLRLHWIRRRAIALAEERLLQEAGLGRSSDTFDQDRVEIIQPGEDGERDGARSGGGVSELAVLEAAERADPGIVDSLIAGESEDPFEMLLDEMTDRRREILLALRNVLASGVDLVEAKKAVADQLSFQPNRINVLFSKLRNNTDDPR